MWVYFNVAESEYLDYIQKVRSKEKQKVLLQMANKAIFETSGYVETIEADFNNETGNIAFRAAFPNPKGILRHGETGNIMMPVQLKNAILIPQKSTFDVLDKKYVYIVDANGVIRSNEITIDQEIPHFYIVASGLKPTDKILLEGLGKVKNNEKIKFNFVSLQKELAEIKNIHAE
jgi:membrane fusion protein (multidrug efflux system)